MEKKTAEIELRAIDVFVKHLGDDALYFARKTDFTDAMIDFASQETALSEARIKELEEALELVKYYMESSGSTRSDLYYKIKEVLNK